MGKLLGMLQYSGKVGETVGMKGADGKNYVRVMASPRNPNTTAQITQRVKMALAGLMSQITPKSALYGLGNSDLKRRSAYTSNIAKKATTSGSGDSIQALLAPADLVFSKGVGRNIDDVLTAAFTQNVLTVTASAMPAEMGAIIVIAVFSEGRTGNYTAVEVKTITSTQLTATFNNTSLVANVYYIPVMQADGASNASYESAVANIEASNSYAAQVEVLTSGVFNYAASRYLNSYSNGSN